jgi:hypothetical protein
MSDAISGRTARKQYEMAAQAQTEQRAEMNKQRANLDLIEKAQRRIARGGGGGGLAYIEGGGLASEPEPLGGTPAASPHRLVR